MRVWCVADDATAAQVRTHAVVNSSEVALDAAALAADLTEAMRLQAEGAVGGQLLAMEAVRPLTSTRRDPVPMGTWPRSHGLGGGSSPRDSVRAHVTGAAVGGGSAGAA